MGNACCQDGRAEYISSIDPSMEGPKYVAVSRDNKEDLIRKYSSIRSQATSLPLTNNRVQEHIRRLSKFGPTSNKMWKLKNPYNLIYLNRDSQQSQQLPKGYIKVYRLKENGDFGGYYEGKISDNYEPDLSDGFFVYHNASYFTGTGHQQGIYTNETTNLRYQGGWVNERPHGKGTEQNNKGSYQGQYFEGEKHGYGKFVWSDGASYEGYFEKGLLHGKGTFKNPSINYSYEGEYSQDYRHGNGQEEKPREFYAGEFYKGKRCGMGKLSVFEDEIKRKLKYTYEGAFQDGNPHGLGTFSDAVSGKKIQGIWDHGTLISIQS